jgi:plasmid stabilization system protein ParE
MAYEVIYRIRFRKKLVRLLDYLERAWGQKVANDFLEKLESRIYRLSKQPQTGIISTKIPSVRSVFITYQNRLFYRIKGEKIEILNLYDTRMNPAKNPYR